MMTRIDNVVFFGTLAFGVAVVILFCAGLVRLHRRRKAAAQPVPEDDVMLTSEPNLAVSIRRVEATVVYYNTGKRSRYSPIDEEQLLKWRAKVGSHVSDMGTVTRVCRETLWKAELLNLDSGDSLGVKAIFSENRDRAIAAITFPQGLEVQKLSRKSGLA
jgi:hypothetical protein